MLTLYLFATGLYAQDYSETFPVPNKGILSGPCDGTDGTTCLSNDFTGVNWTIEGNLSGIDSEPFATNSSGQLVVSDIDEEACWVSPVLEITAATAEFSVDLTWLGYDPDTGGGADFIDIEFTTDGGTNWETIPNLVGGGTHTVEYISGGGSDGEVTINRFNISGSTLQFRVCIDHNSSAEVTTISNIFAYGAQLAGSGPECDLGISSIVATDENCPGSEDGSITVTTTTTNGPVTYSISGPLNRSNSTGIFTGLPPGTYTVSASDDALPATTCTATGEATIEAGLDQTPPTATAPADIIVTCPSDVPPANPDLVTGVMDDCTIPCTTEPWINEFHYDNDGTDAGEFIEIAGPAGLDLSGYAIHTYDGSDRMEDQVFTLDGVIDDEQNGFGALSFATADLQNQMEGIALVKNGTTVIEFLSYEGSFIAVDGPAMGMTSIDVGVEEPATQASEESLSRIGTGNNGTEFTFADQTATSGSLNGNQTIVPCPENVVTVAFQGATDNGGTGSEADPLIITYTYRATDAAGNFTDVTQTVTAVDTEAPMALCQEALAVELDTLAGLAVLDAAMFDMGSVDNCSMVSLSIDRDSLTCDDRGDQIITLTVTDEVGLASTCTTVVTVGGAEAYCTSVSVKDHFADLPRLSLYPNPANDAVSIDLTTLELGDRPEELLIVNTLGQVIYRKSIVKDRQQVLPLNTTDFAPGVYNIQIVAGGRPRAAGRLLIAR